VDPLRMPFRAFKPEFGNPGQVLNYGLGSNGWTIVASGLSLHSICEYEACQGRAWLHAGPPPAKIIIPEKSEPSA
jgi:hypothetical protein